MIRSINNTIKKGSFFSPAVVSQAFQKVFPGNFFDIPYHLGRYVLASVFIWAGATKLADPGAFADLVSVYGIVPDRFLVPVAVGLPVLEVLAGVGLLFDVRGSLETVSALLLLFVFVLWFGILKGLDVDCGCFSPDELREQDGLKDALIRDVWFLVLAGFLFGRRFYRKAVALKIKRLSHKRLNEKRRGR